MAYTAKTRKNFIEAFKKTFGNISLTCKKMQIEVKTYYNWREKFPDFKEECDRIREHEVLDVVESKLMQKIIEGDTTSIIFFLKTRGKKRGYSERFELTGANGKDLIDERTEDEIKAEIEKIQKECEE